MLVGRSAETATITQLLAGAREGRSGVLVVRGEAGVGKSALLEHAAEQAAGFTVLRGTGIESEAELPFAGLHQLLRPALDRLELLPEAQAAALRSAFALSNEPVDARFKISLAVLGLLAEVADERPLLCLVDDAQWLDQPSADGVVFAARRLEAEPVALLFAARDEASRPFDATGLAELRLAPLTPDDARVLVAERLGVAAGADTVDWVVESANGNPLALLELPAALTVEQLAGAEPLDRALPPPTTVEHTYLERVEKLAPETRSVLVIAACEETGDRATVTRAAAELGLDVGALAAAEDARLVAVGRDRIEFRHPLIRSAVYRGAGFAERERAHLALAAALPEATDADRRAWHRAAAAVGADDELAEELEATAERARLRGGHAAAAAALARAADLSTDESASGRRLVVAAAAAWHAGRPGRATALLDRASPIVTEPGLRAQLEHVRGLIQFRCGSLLDATATLVEGASGVAATDPRTALEMLLDAGSVTAKSGDVGELARIAHRAAALPRDDDERQALRLDLLIGVGGIIEGKSAREVPLVRRAVGRAAGFTDPRLLSWAAMGAAAIDDEEAEAALLRRAVSVARESRAVDTLVFVLENVVGSAMLAGRYSVDAEATEGLRLAREAGLSNAATAHLAALAWLAGLRGREAECRAWAAEAIDSARAAGLGNAHTAAQWALAMLDLGGGRPAEAADRLAGLRAAGPGLAHPLLLLTSTPDLVEACVRAGRVEDARAAFVVLDGFAKPRAPAWALGLAARCRGLLLEGADAERALLDALRLHAKGNRPFDRARTELVFGELLRRGRRRIDAREQLRAALATFEELRAEPWAERTRIELRATGETVRKRDPASAGELTPQEEQIARLVGEGHSNKAIAAELFLSPRTVEYHLRKVYAKLGLGSRAELIRRGPALVS